MPPTPSDHAGPRDGMDQTVSFAHLPVSHAECSAQHARIARYLRLRFHFTRGWTSRLDAALFGMLVAGQTRAGISGGVAEIGVHHGRSFIILALGRVADERCLAIDVFEDDVENSTTRHRRRASAFARNCRDNAVRLADHEILKANSTTLTERDILRRVGPPRFFSIDGGHEYRLVSHDLVLAERCASPDAVIVADDFFNPRWPDVTRAVQDWLARPSHDFVPFALTHQKLYLCRADRLGLYAPMLRADPLVARAIRQEVIMGDARPAMLRPSIAARALEVMKSAVF